MDHEISNVINISDHYKDSEYDKNIILNNIDLIRKGLFMSAQHLHAIKPTFLVNKYGSEEEIKNLKIQQQNLIKSIGDTFIGLLEIINYPLNKPSIFNNIIKHNDLEKGIDVLIKDIEYLIRNNSVVTHKPKNLFPINKYKNYFINHVDNIDAFGKSLNDIIKTINKYTKN
jgi:hypothetical protein